jgi:hypothetical protein
MYDILIIKQNGVGASRGPHTVRQWSKSTVTSEIDIKPAIQTGIRSLGNERGHILVKWADKLFICENNGKGGYTRTEVPYHPLADKLSQAKP